MSTDGGSTTKQAVQLRGARRTKYTKEPNREIKDGEKWEDECASLRGGKNRRIQ